MMVTKLSQNVYNKPPKKQGCKQLLLLAIQYLACIVFIFFGIGCSLSSSDVPKDSKQIERPLDRMDIEVKLDLVLVKRIEEQESLVEQQIAEIAQGKTETVKQQSQTFLPIAGWP